MHLSPFKSYHTKRLQKPTFLSSPSETMQSLLQYGLKHSEQASDCVYYFRQELSTVHEYPVLIVADAINVINDYSVYGDPIDPYPIIISNRITV